MLNYLRRSYQVWLDYPLEEGRLLRGRYRIERCIGMGSYGLTYLCADEKAGGLVVAKQAKPSKRRIAASLLEREAELLLRLEGLPVPRLLDRFAEGSKRSFIVMDYMDGLTFEQLIFEHGRVFGERESLAAAAELAGIADRIHRAGYVHLDLRIPNVLMQGERMIVIDFGLARAIGAESAPNGKEATIAEDLAEIGHLLLFLLYSGYEPSGETGPRSWEEELDLREQTRGILRRLLGLAQPYANASELIEELGRAMEECPRHER